jgi:hypothetical protein
MANALVTIVLIHTCPRIKPDVHLGKEATRSESNPVAMTRTIKVLVEVGKDVVKAKAKVRKAPGVSLQAPRAAMLPRLRLSFIN